jgi:hypothetical protein
MPYYKEDYMLRIEEFVEKAKVEGVIDDHTNNLLPFGKVMGFCLFKSNDIGVLLNAKHYQIMQAYVGEDGLVHMSEWSIGGIVSKEKMDTLKGVIAFNNIPKRKTWLIRKVMLLCGETVEVPYDNKR